MSDKDTEDTSPKHQKDAPAPHTDSAEDRAGQKMYDDTASVLPERLGSKPKTGTDSLIDNQPIAPHVSATDKLAEEVVQSGFRTGGTDNGKLLRGSNTPAPDFNIESGDGASGVSSTRAIKQAIDTDYSSGGALGAIVSSSSRPDVAAGYASGENSYAEKFGDKSKMINSMDKQAYLSGDDTYSKSYASAYKYDAPIMNKIVSDKYIDDNSGYATKIAKADWQVTDSPANAIGESTGGKMLQDSGYLKQNVDFSYKDAIAKDPPSNYYNLKDTQSYSDLKSLSRASSEGLTSAIQQASIYSQPADKISYANTIRDLSNSDRTSIMNAIQPNDVRTMQDIAKPGSYDHLSGGEGIRPGDLPTAINPGKVDGSGGNGGQSIRDILNNTGHQNADGLSGNAPVRSPADGGNGPAKPAIPDMATNPPARNSELPANTQVHSSNDTPANTQSRASSDVPPPVPGHTTTDTGSNNNQRPETPAPMPEQSVRTEPTAARGPEPVAREPEPKPNPPVQKPEERHDVVAPPPTNPSHTEAASNQPPRVETTVAKELARTTPMGAEQAGPISLKTLANELAEKAAEPIAKPLVDQPSKVSSDLTTKGAEELAAKTAAQPGALIPGKDVLTGKVTANIESSVAPNAAKPGVLPTDLSAAGKPTISATEATAGAKPATTAAADAIAGAKPTTVPTAADAGKSPIDAKALTPTSNTNTNVRTDAGIIPGGGRVTQSPNQPGAIRGDIAGGKPGNTTGITSGVAIPGRLGDVTGARIISGRGMRADESGSRRYMTGAEIGLLIAAAGIAKSRFDARAQKDGGQAGDGRNIAGRSGKDFIINTLGDRGSRALFTIADGARRFPGREITLSAVLAITGASKFRDVDHHISGGRYGERTVRIVRTIGQHPTQNVEFEIPIIQQPPDKPEDSTSRLDSQLIGFLPAAPGLFRARRKDSSEKDQNENLEEQPENDDQNTPIPIPRFRRLHTVQLEESLTGIAESKLQDVNLAWLIADINASKITEYELDGKRVAELRSGQKLELPLPHEINEFYKKRDNIADPDNLVTIVVNTEVDRERLEDTLNDVLGLRRKMP